MQRKQFLLSGLIVIFVLFGLFAPQAAEARDIIINATPTLDFIPATATATTCGTTDVYVRVNDVVDLTAYHLEVTYDRTKVQVTNVENGGFLAAPGMVELYEPTNTVDDGTGTGRILFGMAQKGTGGDPTPVDGSGNLIKITLKSLTTSGTTELAVDATRSILVDWPDAQSIPFSVAGSTTVTLQSCAPTDIALGNAAVDENKPVGTVVGTLSATDPDAGDTVFTYSLVNATGYPDNASYQIVGSQLQTNVIFDYETKASYQILVRVTGPHGLTYDEVFTIAVNDVNDAPVLAAIGAKSVVNTGTLTFTATATDQDVPADTLSFSVKDAPATATINSTTGAFSWTPTVDTDAGTYYATVCVSDGLLEDCEIVTITVTDGEAPTVVSGVAHGVAPYGDVAMVGTNFAVPQGFVVSTIQFTISEPVTIVGSNVVYMGTLPYGTMAVSGSVVTVTPYAGNEIAAQLGTFTFNVDAGSIEDAAGNALANLSATLIVTDQTAPVIVSITANGATGFSDVTAAGMTLTVEKGYTVETIDIVMSEPVTVVAGTEVTLAGVPYGSVAVSTDGLTLTVTPYAGSEVAGIVGTFNFIVPAGSVKDLAGNAWVNAPVILNVTDTTAPTVVSGVAVGATGFDPVTATAGLTFTVAQGYTVDHIEITMSEAVQIIAPGIVYFEGNPYGTMSASGSVVTITPYARNEIAGLPGTFDFTIDAGSIQDLAGNNLATLTATMVVETSPIFAMTDFGLWGTAWPGAFNVGWQYVPLFDTTTIANIEVGMLDADRKSIVTYTAEGAQLVYQRENGYITAAKLSSAPFYRVYNGNPIVEGPDLNWTVIFGESFEGWSPRWGYVKVTDIYGTVVTHELEYTGPSADLTAPTVGEATAIGVDPYTDMTAEGMLNFTVPQGYMVEKINFTMSEAVTVVAGTEVTLAGLPYGLVTVSADGLTLTVTPYTGNTVANLIGTFSFNVPDGKIFDLSGNPLGTLSATLIVTNVAPVAVDDAHSVAEDGVLTVAARGVLINDTDYDPAVLTAVKVTGPANGTLVLNANGSFTYTPALNFNGMDTFTYKANDGLADSNVATVTITVTSINDTPVLGTIADASIPELVEFSFTATATDVDLPAQALTFSLVGAPEGAAITSAGVFTWTPSELQGAGVYSFTVKVCDDATPALCDEQEVTLTVTEVNVAPVANNLTVTTPEDIPLDITLVATDVDGSALTYVIAAQPNHGTVTLVGNLATYTPALDFNGTDTFTYKANDGTTDSNVATVTITVTSVNDAPLLAPIGPQTVANTATLTITPSARDVDGDVLTWSLGAGAPVGATIDPTTGAFSWSPGTTILPGNYSATICVSDGTLQDCETVTINVTDGVAPVLTSVTPPEGNVYLAAGGHFVLTVDALDDNLYSLEIDHSMEGSLPEFSIYASESDPYGGDEADFALLGVTVAYDGATQTWTIDFGAALTTTFIANPDGITFYLVLKDETGNTWGSMDPTTADNTFAYDLILDDVAPVMESVNPQEGDVYLAGGENFVLTIDAKDTNLYSLEIDHSMEGSLPEFTLYASESDPYGGDGADFIAAGVTVTYNTTSQTWTIDFGSTITNAFITNPNGITFYMVLKDLAGNTWGSMDPTTADNTYEYDLVRDDIAPLMEEVTPPEGDVYLAGGENFVLTIDALDTNLYSLEIDHSMEGGLPEFTLYASASDPYGGDGADFVAAGVTVTYDDMDQIWTIDFGSTITNVFITNGGISFYMVLEDLAGNTWGTMFGTTPENTYEYDLILDDVAPVMESITPPEGDVYLAGGENFVLTIDAKDTNLYSIEIDHSMEGSLPEFTLYASESDPYGGQGAVYATAGVTVTYNVTSQTWTIDFGSTITNAFIANPNGITFYMVLEDLAGNTWGSMDPTTDANTYEYDLILDDVAPVLVSVTPPHDSTVLLGIGDTFKLTIVAEDTNLYSLEIDHSMEGNLPEFTLYASESDPYGGDGADFIAAGVTVTYDDATQTWTIDFGATVSAAIANNGGITFYMVLEDLAGNTWGSMSPTTPANTFKYTVSQDLVAPTIGSGVAKSATNGDVNLVDGKFTVNQGYVVDTIEITMTEPVLVTLGTVVTMEGYGPYGTVTANVGGVITITPYPVNNIAVLIGSFTFTVPAGSVTDLSGNPFTGSIGLEVLNVAPVALNDAYTTDEDVALTVAARGVLINDTDFDPSILTAVKVTGPANGTLVLNANGSFTYTPALNFNGTDTFTYKANDGTTDSNVATVTITVTPLNDTPIAVDDFYTTDEDTTLTIAVPGVMANDSDVDLDIMEVVLVTDVQNGKLSLFGNGSFVYVPDPDFFGTDTFVYRLVTYPGPQSAWIDEAIVTITVNPINDVPVLGLIPNATIPELAVFSFTATATDVDLPAQVLTFSLVGAPEGAAITAGGIFTWMPTEAQGAGVYTFTVKVCDDATPALCDEQAVTLTVSEVNTAPEAQPQAVTTPEETAVGITLVATDAQNDPLTYAIVAQPAHGTVTLVGTTATYTPNLDYFGPDSFTFKANDGLVDSNVATVTITVTNVNDAPVAIDDEYTVAEKATLTVAAPGVLDNDTDVDGDTLSAILVDGVLHGTLTLNADGSFTYTPNAYFNGTDSFTYKAKDAALESDLAVVTITVTPVNDWPIANDDFYEVLTGNDLVKDAAEGVLANDVLLDPDEQVSIQILEGPQHGTLSMNNDGSFTYTPDAGYMGTDTFRYMVLSVRAINAEWSDDALVTIMVKPYMGLFLPIIWR